MIVCKICNEKFNNMITWKHLKKHDITVKEYKEKHGEVVSQEYKDLKSKQNTGVNNPNFGNSMSDEAKRKISQSNKRKTPHNKNKKMSDSQKEILAKKAKERNEEWRKADNHPIKGRAHSEETKEKIRAKRKNQIITTEQVQKAIETKKSKGYDLAFFRGRTHNQSTKNKISQASRKANAIKKQKSVDNAKQRLEQEGYSLAKVEDNLIVIECKSCKTRFTRTRQYATVSKIDSTMCPTCYPPLKGTSKYEQEIHDFLKNYTTIETNNRSIISPKEIDIFLPKEKIGIEFNGLYWHSDKFKKPSYHIEKKNLVNSHNVDLIHIFEDEWLHQKDIVKSRLLSWINSSPATIFARKCKIKEIDSKTANQFLKQNHIQGSGRSNVRLGLYYNDSLVSVMTFLKNDISKNLKGWELNRFCSKTYTQVIGSASKMFRHFVKEYKPKVITSFCDIRWSRRKTVYETLGFKFEHNSSPNYWYFLTNECIRRHRYSLRKPPNCTLTERELRESQGYLRIYDCGSSKWVWTNKKG